VLAQSEVVEKVSHAAAGLRARLGDRSFKFLFGRQASLARLFEFSEKAAQVRYCGLDRHPLG